jgi:hypothetical protein
MSDRPQGVRAAVLTAAETLDLRAFPVPRLGEDDALIRVDVCTQPAWRNSHDS